jgi:hypothetical protein
MNLELDPEEERALVAELRRIIRDDRYPLSSTHTHPASHPRHAGAGAGP